jgi:alcohol dehydrogenase (cytochrome c)
MSRPTPITIALCLWLAAAQPAGAQSLEQLTNDAATPGDVLTYGMGYDARRFSPLKQVDTESVQRLVPVWNFSLASLDGQEAQPLVHDGVMYVTTPFQTFAIDALTGRALWNNKPRMAEDVPKMACCGLINRGAALFEGRLFRTTLDAHVQALDARTGKELWKVKAADYKTGHSMTVAPMAANGVLITGISGGEYGIRGFIDGWDPATGKQLWRRYTIPGPGEPGFDSWQGDAWQRGGGPTWLTGSYDPDLDLVYWGVGNAGPWNARQRPGDNLYTCSVLAIRPKTGEIVWHYQFSPNDLHDYDGVNELILAELPVGGKPRKVLMQANRNGFLYVLDRASGELLAANPFVKVNWAEGIDMKTGRPIESTAVKKVRASGETAELWPSAFGGKNWMPASYDPRQNLLFANTLNVGMPYTPVKAEYKPGEWYWGMKFTGFAWPDGPRGALKALDPLTGQAKWEMPYDIPSWSGTLATAGNLVFTGAMTGEFMAVDSRNGKKLWQFQTGSGVIGQPVTWERDGRQYVTVLSGIGGVFPLFAGDPRLAKVPTGGSVWTFALPE